MTWSYFPDCCSVYVHGDVFQPLRFRSSGQFVGWSNCFSSPPSLPLPDTTAAHKKCRHTALRMLSAMTETVIRKQTTQRCYNRSMAGSEFHFASQRQWELRKLVKGIFSSHTSASLCSLSRGQLLTDNTHSLMCSQRGWRDKQRCARAEAHVLQQPEKGYLFSCYILEGAWLKHLC